MAAATGLDSNPNDVSASGALRAPANITKSDGTTYDPPIACVRVGDIAGGDTMVCKDVNDVTVTFLNIAEGEVIWGPFSKVMSTSTTVAGLVAWKA